jgi:Protein of unknown function (DUF1420)
MALIASLAALCGAAIFCVACAGLGNWALQTAHLESENALVDLLCSIAAGVIAYETALSVLLFAAPPRTAVYISLIILLLTGSFGLSGVLRILGRLARGIRVASRHEHLLEVTTGFVVLFTGLVAVAPLTGSDALHYHFTSQSLVLRDGFVPHFSLVNSFFTGQGHLLILTGLALHSEKLALALIVAGGILAAAACACLARQWLSREWAWLCALTFLLTPVVFWQVSTAGAPDIWMAFFAVTGVLAVARARINDRLAITILMGALAGALAGAKYTGCIFAAALTLAFLIETRSLRRLGGFLSAAVTVGIWPYARNLLWTHDPVFPFLLNWFAPEQINSFTRASMLADTGASGPRSIVQLSLFPLFAAVDHTHAGFWQFFGPLPLAFVFLIISAWRNTPLWRAAGIVWLVSSVLIAASSGMLRFLLPMFPVAIAAAFAGAARLDRYDWRIARALSFASIGVFLVLCLGGILFYGRAAAETSIGLLSREAYLNQLAPDYGRVSFINDTLAGRESEGKALVFLRHLYYLRVPFVSGDPGHNWEIDPQRYAAAQAWEAFFRAQNIRWVVRAPGYPPAVAATLQQLEDEGRLVPMARADVSDFDGLRLFGVRKTTPVVILRVKE